MKKQVKLTLPEEMVTELEIKAEKTGLTVATYVRQLVYQHLQKKDDSLVYHRRDKKELDQEIISEKIKKVTWKKLAHLL